MAVVDADRPLAAVAAAVNLMEHQPFEVALVDIRMPGMDGLKTLAHMEKPAPDLEVIMLIGHASMELVVHFENFLIKAG